MTSAVVTKRRKTAFDIAKLPIETFLALLRPTLRSIIERPRDVDGSDGTWSATTEPLPAAH